MFRHPYQSLDGIVSAYRELNRSDLTFLQVGAYDGVSGDPIYPLVKKHGLSGILVEPQPEAFLRLKHNYAHFRSDRFHFINAALGTHDGTAMLYRIKDGAEVPDWLAQAATLRLNTLLSHSEFVPQIKDIVQVIEVPCMTFDTLFATVGLDRVDILQIDAEGYDDILVNAFQVEQRNPVIIHFEHKHLAALPYVRTLINLHNLRYQISLSNVDTIAYRW